MAITLTTLAGAVAVDQNTIQVVSATGCTAGCFVKIDQEILQVQSGYPLSGTSVLTVPVLRGRESSATQAHPIGAQVKFFLGSDTTSLPGQQAAVEPITTPARQRLSYTAAGAITLPSPSNDMDAVLNGAVALAMTVAAPTTDMDGSTLRIYNNGLAAHTATVSGGLGGVGATADVQTWVVTQRAAIVLIACGGFWLGTGQVAGAPTIAGVGIA